MTRKDSEKDADRPHYYSQFWLDVAAGRRIIGAPKGEEGEIMEPDLNESDTPIRMSTSARAIHDDYDDNAQDNGYTETIAHPVVTPDDEPLDVEIEPNDLDDLDIQNDEMEDAEIPDMDLDPIDEAEEEDEEDFLDEDEEDEEDDGWNARGRKKPSPKRPTKQPPAKKPKREPRRGF